MSFYTADRIYELIPAFYRVRDYELAEQSWTAEHAAEIAGLRSQLELAVAADPNGPDATRLRRRLAQRSAGPLRALVEILAEQIAVLEEDLEQLEDDQFIETCSEWVVPYIGELVGTRGLTELPGGGLSRRAQVANTLAYRRRKGTAAVIEQLARDVTGWDASVVEFFELLIATQYMNHVRPQAMATVSLRGIDLREPVNSPFGRAAHTVDVRRIARGRGKFNIPNVGVHLWRVRSFPWTDVPAFRHDDRRYSFHPLGLDIPLYNAPTSEETISHLATPDNVARPLRRRETSSRLSFYYGRNNAFALSRGGIEIPREQTCICDLSDWSNGNPTRISIDPQLGRIVFPDDQPADADIRTVHRYGFGFPMGGGEYGRSTTIASDITPVAIVSGGDSSDLQAALSAVGTGGAVEIRDNSVYSGSFSIDLQDDAAIEFRSADRNHPIISLGSQLEITGASGASVTLNGLLLDGASIRVPATRATGTPNQLRLLRIEHCTVRPGSPPISLIVEAPEVRIEIERSILGAIRVIDTAEVEIANSALDAQHTGNTCYSAPVDGAPGAPLTIRNSTLIGRLYTRLLTLASNVIFWADTIQAERLQEGCVRFSYVPLGSLVPRRHECHPVNAAEAARLRIVFGSLEYGDPDYLLLHPVLTSQEILTGADDRSEMGAFHDLYQPQRESALRARLHEHMRFGLEAGVFYAS